MSEIDFLEQSKKFKAAQAKLKGGTAVQEPQPETTSASDTITEATATTLPQPAPVLDQPLSGIIGQFVKQSDLF
jgi:hypothetical protein